MVRVSYHFTNGTGRDKQEAYISSEHICGLSILYPDFRAPKSSRLLMVGYGVPPKHKEEGKIRCNTHQLSKEAKRIYFKMAMRKWKFYAPIVRISQSRIPNAHLLI